MTVSDFGTLFSRVLSFFSYRCRSQALAFLAAPLAHSKADLSLQSPDGPGPYSLLGTQRTVRKVQTGLNWV